MIASVVLSTIVVLELTQQKVVETQLTNDIAPSDFCDYVGIFSQQIARNKMRNVPFSRLNEFNYFNDAYSNFLETVALEIYERENLSKSSLSGITLEYHDLCESMF